MVEVTVVSEGFRAILTLGNPNHRIVVDGKEYRFERDYTGCPWLLNRRGDPTHVPGVKHPFWGGFYRWSAQGERMDGDLCLWQINPPMKVRRLPYRGRHYETVETPPGWVEADGTEEVRHD